MTVSRGAVQTVASGMRSPAWSTVRKLTSSLSAERPREAHVQMVVVIRERLNDAPRAAEPDARSDEDLGGACRHEPVDEPLSFRPVHLRGAPRLALPAVGARVVDVDVEAVLVRDVYGAEVAAAPAA